MAKPKHFVEIGARFGRGVVTAPEVRVPERRTVRRMARLTCDCGDTYLARVSGLATGNQNAPTSCGCAHREHAQEMGRANRKHGLHAHPLYDIWPGMMRRCYSPKNPKYGRYGGRGIGVYAPWHDVAAFIADIERLLGDRPEGYSLDRKDNDGDYAPGNVQWATALEQAANREYQLALTFLAWARQHHPEIITEFRERF